jgi:hypothetical protein
MTERLGGDKAVRDKLLKKGKSRKGMTRELEQINAEARDTDVTPDSVLEAYVNETDLTLQDARRQTATLSERRAVEDLAKRVSALERELRAFRIDLDSAPNLRELRRSLSTLAETAAHLEVRVASAMRDADVSK